MKLKIEDLKEGDRVYITEIKTVAETGNINGRVYVGFKEERPHVHFQDFFDCADAISQLIEDDIDVSAMDNERLFYRTLGAEYNAGMIEDNHKLYMSREVAQKLSGIIKKTFPVFKDFHSKKDKTVYDIIDDLTEPESK